TGFKFPPSKGFERHNHNLLLLKDLLFCIRKYISKSTSLKNTIKIYQKTVKSLTLKDLKREIGGGGSRTVRIFEVLSDSLILPKSPNPLTFLEIGI
ncbi:hypothetical protein CMK20_14525, partial [Candidatus Poribacteria bacterium]|nr:hypothetical protein [Candidatus Poribacteria bacterium]